MSQYFKSAQHQTHRKRRSFREASSSEQISNAGLMQRAAKNPNAMTSEDIIALQRSHGNQFVLQLMRDSNAAQASQSIENNVYGNNADSGQIQRVDSGTLITSGVSVGGGALFGGLITWLTGMPVYVSTPLFGILGGIIGNMLGSSEEDTDEFEESRRQRLEENSFRTSAGLEIYGQALYKGFNGFLSTLEADDSWLDGGAGQAQAMHDYHKGGGKAAMTAVNYKLPENQAMIEEMLESSGIDFASLEGDFETLFNKKKMPVGAYKLITDNNGVLMYSKQVDQDLLKYIRLLKPGGRLYASSSEIRIFDSREDYEGYGTGFNIPKEKEILEAYSAWVNAIKGVDIIKDNPLTLERNDDEINVPELELLHYNGETSPPKRAYKRA